MSEKKSAAARLRSVGFVRPSTGGLGDGMAGRAVNDVVVRIVPFSKKMAARAEQKHRSNVLGSATVGGSGDLPSSNNPRTQQPSNR